jgi:hypothetical protein
MMKQIALAILIFMCLCSGSKKKETGDSQDKEIIIYNTLLDSLYNIQYCPNYPKMPIFNNFKNDTTSKEFKDWVIKYDKYKIERDKRNNDKTVWLKDFKEMLDTMDLITFVDTTLYKLDIEKDINFLLEELSPNDSIFFNLVKSCKINILSRPFQLEILKQPQINFINSKWPFYKDNESFEYGLVDRKYYIGEIKLSRIYIDEQNDVGIFHFAFHGGPMCGYGKYVFIIKINDKWIIHKTIEDWIS